VVQGIRIRPVGGESGDWLLSLFLNLIVLFHCIIVVKDGVDLLHKTLRRTGHSSRSSDCILWELPWKGRWRCFIIAYSLFSKWIKRKVRAWEVTVYLLWDSLFFSEVSVHWSTIWILFDLGSFSSLLTWLHLDSLSLHLFWRKAGKFLQVKLGQDIEAGLTLLKKS
jgi:hypothetical protein